jgi:hypothetical protein
MFNRNLFVYIQVIMIAFTLPFLVPSSGMADKTVIRHKGFEDFRKGTFGDGGANTYVSRNGGIQLINRWDLNNDGYLDILINHTHNAFETPDAFIYWGTADGYHSLLPAFWKQLPAYKIFSSLNEQQKYMGFLPTFGGGPCKIGDYNCDGFPDIAFINTIHNYSYNMEAYVYWGGPQGYSAVHRSELPILFAQDIESVDLNRDGYLDLVFANYGREYGSARGYLYNKESYIYWGGTEGFSVDQRSSIATVSARSCTSGDFNGDGWPDLAFVNTAPEPGVYVYLNDKGRFSQEKRPEIREGNPQVVRSGDVDNDGTDDLIVISNEGVVIYKGGPSFRLEKSYKLPAKRVKDIKVVDLNNDMYNELILASSDVKTENESPTFSALNDIPTRSQIYWGSKLGFDPGRCTQLPTLYPSAVEVADLNDDGYKDIVFANAGTSMSTDVSSFIYWGAKDGFDPSRRTHIQGFGAGGVGVSDFNRDGRQDILLMNLQSTTKPNPSVVFWGNPANYYSEANATLIQAEDPYYSKIVDLNDDGYMDIVFDGLEISWGSAQGFGKQTKLGVKSLGVTVQDFNRDGYLDLGVNIYSPRKGLPDQGKGYVIWGSPEGYTFDNKTLVTDKNTALPWGVTSADLNKDGYLDLVYASGNNMKYFSEIVWGGPGGYENAPSTFLKTNRVQSPAIADLNNDGWLDLIFPSGLDVDTDDTHTPHYIYWGSEKGFSDDRREELDVDVASFEISVADLNGDGFLDIVSGSYQANKTRHLPLYIYWGNAAHHYSNENRTQLPGMSSAGIEILDLNRDGYPEIIATNHVENGDHNISSYIYWGDKKGFSIDRRTSLPTIGPHMMRNVDVGNIYDRSPCYDYISPVVTVPAKAKQLTLEWKGDTPHKSDIRFECRIAETEPGLVKFKWIALAPQKTVTLARNSAFLQYRAILVSTDGGSSPVLREVTLLFE